MRKLLVLPAVAVVVSAELYRRGAVAPLAYGVKALAAALGYRNGPWSESDPIG